MVLVVSNDNKNILTVVLQAGGEDADGDSLLARKQTFFGNFPSNLTKVEVRFACIVSPFQ